MFAAFAAAVMFFAVVAFAMTSPEMCLDVLVWYFFPNNNSSSLDHAPHMINVAIATAMWYMLPVMVLVEMLLFARTYLGKVFAIATWITSLFVVEEMFYIELLRPDLFVAVLALSAMYLLAFLRVPLMIKITFLLIARIMGIVLRTFRFVTRLIVVYLIHLILAPLVLPMVVQNILRVMSNSNLPTFGMFVIVGSSFAILLLLYGIGKKLLQLALRVFDVLLDAIVSVIDPLPPAADEEESAAYIARLPLAPQVRWPDDVVSGHFVLKHEAGRFAAWQAILRNREENYKMRWRAQGALLDLVPLFDRFKRDHPRRFRSWSNYEKMLRECKLYEQGIDVIFLEMKLRAEFRSTPLLAMVQETWKTSAFNNAEMIEEAAVEPVARAREDTDATPQIQGKDRLDRHIQAAVEVLAVEKPVAFDKPVAMEERVHTIEEAAVEPVARAREDADATPQIQGEDRLIQAAVEVLAVEEPVAFDQPVAMEEREQEEENVPTPIVKRRRRRSEVASLNSELGKYWACSSRPRRGAQARKELERYKP